MYLSDACCSWTVSFPKREVPTCGVSGTLHQAGRWSCLVRSSFSSFLQPLPDTVCLTASSYTAKALSPWTRCNRLEWCLATARLNSKAPLSAMEAFHPLTCSANQPSRWLLSTLSGRNVLENTSASRNPVVFLSTARSRVISSV